MSELDTRLQVCPRQGLSRSVVGVTLAGLALVVVLGSIPALRESRELRRVPRCLSRRRVLDVLPRVFESLPGPLRVVLENYSVGGSSVGELGVVGIWLSCQLMALVLAARGVGGFPLDAQCARALGHLAACGFMVVLLPVSRSSLWPKLVGLSYERAVQWHRMAGTFTLVATGVHGGIMLRDYGYHESSSAKRAFHEAPIEIIHAFLSWFCTQSNVSAANCFGSGNLYGTLIFVVGGLLFIFSQAPVRRHYYRVFHIMHVLLVPAILVLACLHVHDLILFLVPPVVIELVCNQLGRLLAYCHSTRVVSARVIANADTIELRLCAPHVVAPLMRKPYLRLGSWVWLSVAGDSADCYDPHPFSIAGLGPDNELKLLIKVCLPCLPHACGFSLKLTWSARGAGCGPLDCSAR